ncbi:hypothetical protein ACJ73_04568, partial [Blastomyces percursus]
MSAALLWKRVKRLLPYASDSPNHPPVPVPEPDISYTLYERVIINGTKDPLKTKYRTASIHDPAISIYSIKYTAKRMAEEYVAKQNCKE